MAERLGRCCIPKARDRGKYDENPSPIYVISPTLFQDGDMVQDGRLCTMLAMFIGRSKLERLRALLSQDPDTPGYDPSGQLMLLSSQMCAHFANGRVSLKADPLQATSTLSLGYLVPTQSATHRSTPSIRTRFGIAGSIRLHAAKTQLSQLSAARPSQLIRRLPFNLYLRIAHQGWAPRHQAELRSLQIVQAYTRVPAPRGIDTIQYRESSYLLMTGLHGYGIGHQLCTMTDEQLNTAAQDLKTHLTALRRIPNTTNSPFRICNPLGGGILDWRIADSQRKQLRFHTETEFNHFLTDDLPLDEDAWTRIAKSHGVKHDIVFTHADLSLRNILVDETGRISGIVDWECAGWYPEYWEHARMHFTVRRTQRWTADVFDQIFPGYRDELDVENLLSAMVPPWYGHGKHIGRNKEFYVGIEKVPYVRYTKNIIFQGSRVEKESKKETRRNGEKTPLNNTVYVNVPLINQEGSGTEFYLLDRSDTSDKTCFPCTSERLHTMQVHDQEQRCESSLEMTWLNLSEDRTYEFEAAWACLVSG
ncbi:hypothetical protein OPT61_g9348 [Boeremia exigua]|uniref:Uncharacterized protein n=1 Tax=Boeremia exigua TaxID=749465 RepID=A0ACC2HV21_9PLEO|nr:hypothetical protein OPT61_g9348 [Boeremia exigua]